MHWDWDDHPLIWKVNRFLWVIGFQGITEFQRVLLDWVSLIYGLNSVSDWVSVFSFAFCLVVFSFRRFHWISMVVWWVSAIPIGFYLVSHSTIGGDLNGLRGYSADFQLWFEDGGSTYFEFDVELFLEREEALVAHRHVVVGPRDFGVRRHGRFCNNKQAHDEPNSFEENGP